MFHPRRRKGGDPKQRGFGSWCVAATTYRDFRGYSVMKRPLVLRKETEMRQLRSVIRLALLGLALVVVFGVAVDTAQALCFGAGATLSCSRTADCKVIVPCNEFGAFAPNAEGTVGVLYGDCKVVNGKNVVKPTEDVFDIGGDLGDPPVFLFGRGKDDRICADDDDDTVEGGPGGDGIDGEEGDDTLLGQGGDDLIFGQDGDDFINGGGGNDILEGGDDNDDIRGGGGNDEIDGNDGEDNLEGGAGRDDLFGGDGEDSLEGGPGFDECDGGDQDDQITAVGPDACENIEL